MYCANVWQQQVVVRGVCAHGCEAHGEAVHEHGDATGHGLSRRLRAHRVEHGMQAEAEKKLGESDVCMYRAMCRNRFATYYLDMGHIVEFLKKVYQGGPCLYLSRNQFSNFQSF